LFLCSPTLFDQSLGQWLIQLIGLNLSHNSAKPSQHSKEAKQKTKHFSHSQFNEKFGEKFIFTIINNFGCESM
jgi:hypothetical protein